MSGLSGVVAGPSAADATAGAPFGWGDNINGQLGDGTTDPALSPVATDTSGELAGVTVTKVSAGDNATCALTTEGRVYCWGFGGNGALGNGSVADSAVPVAIDASGVMDDKEVIDINVMSGSACAITSDGKVYCWGSNDFGQLGNGTLVSASAPVAVDTSGVLADRRATSLGSGGFATTCVTLDDGGAACWGAGIFGSMGNGTNAVYNTTPVLVSMAGVLSGKDVAQLAVGTFHVCALTTDTTLACWGRNGEGELGIGDTTNRNVPALVDTSGVLDGLTVTTMAAGGETTCAIAGEGQVFCWGDGTYGALGAGSTASVNVPQAVDMTGVLAGQQATSVSVGAYHSCVATASGLASCWGKGDNGQLGVGVSTESTVPLAVDQTGALAGWTVTAVSASPYRTMVLAHETGGGGPRGTSYQFTYWLDRETECTSISPVTVMRGTVTTLPEESADCRTEGSTVAGWTIPGDDRVFRPGAVVYVVDSQQFTAVLREPGVTVRYDANVGGSDSCLHDGIEVPIGERTESIWLPRDAVGTYPLAAAAVCAPPGHRLAGWLWRTAPEPTVLTPGGVSPEEWNVEGTSPVNRVRLFAVWLPVGQG